jgi:AraC family transcriptional regulator
MPINRDQRNEVVKEQPAARFAINPREAILGTENAILSGTNNSYYVPDYEGCLSIKTIVSGSASWEAAGRRFVVHENSYLILNDRQRYTMTIDAARPVTTFCLFFQRGFVEDVFRSTVTPTSSLLDAPEGPNALRLGFWEKLESQENRLLELIRALRRRILQGTTERQTLEDDFYSIAAEMIGQHQQTESAIARLPARRSATKMELYRRLLRGRDHLLSSLDQPVRLSEVARAACLSPSHFHRTFTRAFGETPQRYLTRHRLQRAGQLLRQNHLAVTEVCLESGFESLGSFSSLFRRHFGLSPSEFRRAHRKLAR